MTLGTARSTGGRDVDALHAMVRIQMTAGGHPDEFEWRLRGGPTITEAWRLAGDCDFEVLLVPEPRVVSG